MAEINLLLSENGKLRGLCLQIQMAKRMAVKVIAMVMVIVLAILTIPVPAAIVLLKPTFRISDKFCASDSTRVNLVQERRQVFRAIRNNSKPHIGPLKVILQMQEHDDI
jgi:predicted transcriptional regulator